MAESYAVARSQPRWYVNTASSATPGDNSKKGDDPSSAIRSTAEIFRKWGPGPVSLTAPRVDVFVDGDLTDLGNLSLNGAVGSLLWFHGTRTVVPSGSGTFSAVTPINPGTTTRPTVTAVGAPWSANVGRILRETGTNKVAMITADLGTNIARLSNPVIEPTTFGSTFSPTPALFTNGAAFNIESYPLISKGNVFLSGSGGTSNTLPAVIFENFVLGAGTDNSTTLLIKADSTTVSALLMDCPIRAAVFGGAKVRINNPYFGGSAIPLSNVHGLALISAGVTAVGSHLTSAFYMMFDVDHLHEGNALSTATNLGNLGSGFGIHQLGCFPTADGADCFALDYASKAILVAGGRLWGAASGAGTYGVRCDGKLHLGGSAVPTVTGTAGDTIIGGTPKQYADIPYTEGLNGAAIVAI